MDATPVPGRPPTAEDLRARLWQAVEDLRAGRITAAEAQRVTKVAGDELQILEAMMRAARVVGRLEDL